jgi:hypothetical protein
VTPPEAGGVKAPPLLLPLPGDFLLLLNDAATRIDSSSLSAVTICSCSRSRSESSTKIRFWASHAASIWLTPSSA